MEFDGNGKFVRSIADDLFVTPHLVRVDSEDNVWTVDIGSHVLLKLNPEGRILLALGRMRIPGDDVGHFKQLTDVAWDRNGNVYVTDGSVIAPFANEKESRHDLTRRRSRRHFVGSWI